MSIVSNNKTVKEKPVNLPPEIPADKDPLLNGLSTHLSNDPADSNLSMKIEPIAAIPAVQSKPLFKTPYSPKEETPFEWGNFFRGLVLSIRRLFSFPLVKGPISFSRPGDFTNTGASSGTSKVNTGSLEVLCSYDVATKELFEHIMKDQKEATDAVKDNYHSVQVDSTNFPEWTDSIIDGLRGTFQVFDIPGDGLVDFDELSAILTSFGDTTPIEERKSFFEEVDTDNSGAINFMEFIKMIYNITVIRAGEPAVRALSDSIRAVDPNLARIRFLDVVQQLQAGLKLITYSRCIIFT